MLTIAAILNIGVVIGLCLLAAKYAFGPIPTDHHRAILAEEPSNEVIVIFRALYWTLAGALIGLAVGVGLITFFGVLNDMLWAKVAVLLTALAAGLPASVASYRVERGTGVQTPWRSAAGLAAIVVIAFVISMI